jgi:hypothetical protein
LKKTHVALAVCVPIVVLALVAAVVYVSLLGENNKIDELTRAFFQEIGGGTYGEATKNVRVKAPGPAEETSDSLFLLELSLLKHYNLLNNEAFEVVTRRDHLWIPYVDDSPVQVSVSLKKKPDGNSLKEALSRIGRSWSSDKDADSIGRLLTVRRKKGNWVIESVNISGSVIEKTYGDMRERLRLHQHVTKAPHGFIIHEFPVRLDGLDPVERLVLLHVLQKAQTRLEGPRPVPPAQGVPGTRLR